MLIITNGKVFCPSGFVEKDVVIENGKISKVARLEASEKEKIPKGERIDAKGMLVLPGLIDAHVHLRDPGETHKEDFSTGTKAALAGGITAMLDMPNNAKPITDRARLIEKMRLARRRALCSVYFYMACAKGNFEEIRKASPIALKMYLFKTTRTGEIFISDDKDIEKHFENFDKNKPITIHAEGNDVGRACELAKKHKRKIHLAHASTLAEMEIAKDANATVELTPHHLFLSKKDAEKLGEFGKVYPALKEESERAKLFANFELADCIATDHAPHTMEDKEEGAAGFPGLETSLALMLDAYNRKLVKLESVIGKMSSAPAKIFGLKNEGSIETGMDANFALVDPRMEWKVRGEELQTKCKWSPFEGKTLKGKCVSTIYRGKIVYEDGEFNL